MGKGLLIFKPFIKVDLGDLWPLMMLSSLLRQGLPLHQHLSMWIGC